MPLTNEHLFKKTAILHITLSTILLIAKNQNKIQILWDAEQFNLHPVHPSVRQQLADGTGWKTREGRGRGGGRAGQEDKEGLLSCYVIRSDREEWKRE